jgi:hypothetical protein
MLIGKSVYSFCVLLAVSVPAFCTAIVYNDKASWQTATSGISTVDFEGIAAPGDGNFTPYDTPSGVTINGVNFIGYNPCVNCDALAVISPTLGGFYDFGFGSELLWSYFSSGSVPYLQVTLPQPVTSVGLNLMTHGGSSSYNVALNNLNFTYSSASTNGWPNNAFFGITSDTSFTTIAFQLPSSATFVIPVIDNFSYGTAGTAQQTPADTPEICTFLMIASGLIGLAFWGKRFRIRFEQAA